LGESGWLNRSQTLSGLSGGMDMKDYNSM